MSALTNNPGRPFVTVVMTVYREPVQIIRASLQSVLDQTWPAFEIILVNDSGAGRPEISALAQLGGNISIIDHSRNSGGSVARNTGIDAAQGTLIAFIDADDLWYPTKLETQLDVDADHHGSFFASNCMLVRKGGRRLCNARPPDLDRSLSTFLLREGGALQTSTLIVPAARAKEIGFRAGLKRHQDWDFVLRLQQAGVPLVYQHQALSDYILGDNPDRVSLQKKGYLATVEWFKLTKGQVSAADQQYYFFRHCMTLKSLRTPFSLTIAALHVIALSPVNGVKEAMGAVWRGLVRSRRRELADQTGL